MPAPSSWAALAAGLVMAATSTMPSAQALPEDEAGALQVLRFIASAQMAYSASCGRGFFAPGLEILARPTPGSSIAFLRPHLVPPKGETVLEKYNYRIEMTALPSRKSPAGCSGVAAGDQAETFSGVARPLDGFTGTWFELDTKGQITEIK